MWFQKWEAVGARKAHKKEVSLIEVFLFTAQLMNKEAVDKTKTTPCACHCYRRKLIDKVKRLLRYNYEI